MEVLRVRMDAGEGDNLKKNGRVIYMARTKKNGKGKNQVQKIPALFGAIETLRMQGKIAAEGYDSAMASFRAGALREENDKFIVDTCVGFDTGIWETGIAKGGGNMVIVEQYKDAEEAAKGHEKWVRKMIADPNQELEDIDLWGIGVGSESE